MAVTRTDLIDATGILMNRVRLLRMAADSFRGSDRESSDALHTLASDFQADLTVLIDGLVNLEVQS